jgi:hypothetical protein
VSLFEANSRAIKRVERLKAEVAKKLEGLYVPRRLLDRDWSVALDVVAPYDAALPHQVQLGIRESALHALSGLSALAHAQDPAIPTLASKAIGRVVRTRRPKMQGRSDPRHSS